MTDFFELKVDTTQLYSELVSEILLNKGCGGTVLSEEYFSDDYTNENSGYVKTYIADIEENKALLSEIQEELYQTHQQLMAQGVNPEETGSWQVSYKIVADEDWSESWKQYWHPQRIGKNFIVCPGWEPPENTAEEDVVISLDPGSAFGTGTHPTTRLCMKALERIVKDNPDIDSLLDIGTGSGIIAIAAAKLGIKRVVGTDIDPLAVKIAKENAIINNVQDYCTFEVDSIKHINEEFDVVVVNILARVIIPMIEDIKKKTRKDGIVILSGLIKSKAEDVIDPLENTGFRIEDVECENEWAEITAIRK